MAKQNKKPFPLEFKAPIPGMSLTTEPGNRPWEQPPQYADMEDVIQYYMERIGDDEKVDNLLAILETGMPINSLVSAMTSSGSMNGLHTVESGLMAGPVLSEFIQAIADINEVEYVVSAGDDNPMLSRADAGKLKKKLSGIEMAKLEGTYTSTAATEEDDTESEDSTSGTGKGLMSRPEIMTDDESDTVDMESDEDVVATAAEDTDNEDEVTA